MKIKLTKEQQKIKEFIIEQMGNSYKPIDEPVVDNLAFAIDTLDFMNSQLNDVRSLLSDKVFMSSREKIRTQMENGYKLLDISPQARNKSNIETAKTVDPLTELLGDM